MKLVARGETSPLIKAMNYCLLALNEQFSFAEISFRATKLLHHVEENESWSTLQLQQTWQRELHLTNKGKHCFSHPIAFALMELEGFAFKVSCVFWAFLLPMERKHSQRSFEPYGSVVCFFFSVRAALTNRQYFDHFTQHSFNSSWAVPLGALWAYH